MGASPADRQNLAPVDVGNIAPFTGYIRGAFSHLRFGSLHPRGRNTGLELNSNLGVGYYDALGNSLRGAASSGSYVQGRRGQMANIPTPQELIRQVTGIGDMPNGR